MTEAISPVPTAPKGGGSLSPLMTQSHDKRKPKKEKKKAPTKPAK